MSDDYTIPTAVEVDQAPAVDGELPTYQELAEHAPANSRFGRWREWIDKRAQERFADTTEEERDARRRRLGWGENLLASPTDYTRDRNPGDFDEPETPPPPVPPRPVSDVPPPLPPPPPRSASSSSRPLPIPPIPSPAASLSLAPPHPRTPETLPLSTSPALSLGQPLPPTSLASYSFGSRFIPHSPLPILSLLPLAASDRFLLLGTADGLAVLDVLPRLHGANSGGRGLEDARRRELWTGVGVCQTALVEEETKEVPGGGVSQHEEGVVLMLVTVGVAGKPGAGGEERERRRELRMYKLSSLLSLVRWTVSQEDSRPLDLAKSLSADSAPPTPQQKKESKARHRLSKPLPLSLVPNSNSSSNTSLLRPASPQPPSRASSQRSTRERSHSAAQPPTTPPPTNTTWDNHSLPYRWATDFQPFHHPRLPSHPHEPILFFELWKASEYGQFGRTMLAVATTKNVVLFEAPVGERAWTFVKEYYVPNPPRTVRFVYQSVSSAQLQASRSVTPDPTIPTPYHVAGPSNQRDPLPQLSLYLTFEKKAVIIRLSDAVVSEVDLWSPDHSPDDEHPHLSTGGSLRRKHASIDGALLVRDRDYVSPPPLVPVYVPVPASSPTSPSESKLFYLLTRGRSTNIYASPLPSAPTLASRPPLYRHTWTAHAPREVVARVSRDGALQIMAFGSGGVEIVELAASDLLSGGGSSGKSRAPPTTVFNEGLETGFLHTGGQWDCHSLRTAMRTARSSLQRVQSGDSAKERREREEKGVYAWVKRDLEDERVFWLGGCDRVE